MSFTVHEKKEKCPIHINKNPKIRKNIAFIESQSLFKNSNSTMIEEFMKKEEKTKKEKFNKKKRENEKLKKKKRKRKKKN